MEHPADDRCDCKGFEEKLGIHGLSTCAVAFGENNSASAISRSGKKDAADV
jgi:hypothetical protein